MSAVIRASPTDRRRLARAAAFAGAPVGLQAQPPPESEVVSTSGRIRLWTTEETADFLGVSIRTVKELMSSGALAYVKVGRATRLDPSDVESFVRSHRRRRRSV